MRILDLIKSIFRDTPPAEEGSELGHKIIELFEGDLRRKAPSEIEDYNDRIKKEPGNSNLYNLRGFAKENLDDNAGALKDYNSAIQLDGNSAVAYYNKGLLKLTKLNDKSGCQDLEKAADLGLRQAKEAWSYYCKK